MQVLSLFIEAKKKQKIPTLAVTKLMSGMVGKLSCPCGLGEEHRGEVSGSASTGGSCNFFLEVFLLAQFIQFTHVHGAVTYLPSFPLSLLPQKKAYCNVNRVEPIEQGRGKPII